MRLAFALGAVALAWGWTAEAQAADRTAWQIKAELAVRRIVDDTTADQIRGILTAVGKNTHVHDISVEPDGDGVLAKITLKWTGIVIAVDYSAVIRWRFTKDFHINSGIDSFIGLNVVTEKMKRELDDYLRAKVYPLVQASAAK